MAWEIFGAMIFMVSKVAVLSFWNSRKGISWILGFSSNVMILTAKPPYFKSKPVAELLSPSRRTPSNSMAGTVHCGLNVFYSNTAQDWAGRVAIPCTIETVHPGLGMKSFRRH